MKPSDGPIGTVIFFPYVGNTPLFGPEEWISIAARVINALVISLLTYSLVCLCANTFQQRSLDHLITPERLKTLTSRWARELGEDVVRPARSSNAYVPATPKAKLVLDDAETKEAKDSHAEGSSPSQHFEDDDTRSTTKSRTDSEAPPSYQQPTRTNTGILKLGLLRQFSSRQDPDLSVQPPDYVLYEPTFEQLSLAYDLLKASTTCDKQRKDPFFGFTFIKIWFFIFFWLGDFAWYLLVQLRHPFRPGILLAIRTHASTLRFACTLSYPKLMRLAIRHPAYRSMKSSKDIVLASRLILSTEAVVKPTRFWQLAMGYAMLGACSVLVIGTELTIQWNKIQGVQNLRSVGQLIPFTLGVGSLLKIVWSAVAYRGVRADRFCYYEYCANETRRREVWEEAGKRFLDCREAYAGRRVVEEEERKVE